MSTLEVAIAVAAKAHAGQLDKGGQPYILHPLAVMLAQASDAARIVAVLHDVVEDTEVTLADLDALGFGPEVVGGVDALTRRDGEVYRDFVLRAAAHPLGRPVKLADLAHNSDLARLPAPTERDHDRGGALPALHRADRRAAAASGCVTRRSGPADRPAPSVTGSRTKFRRRRGLGWRPILSGQGLESRRMTLDVLLTPYKFRAANHLDAERFFGALRKRGVPVGERRWRYDRLDIGEGESVPIPDVEWSFAAMAGLDELRAVAYLDIPDGAVIGETLALADRYTGVRTYRAPDPLLAESLPEPRGGAVPAPF